MEIWVHHLSFPQIPTPGGVALQLVERRGHHLVSLHVSVSSLTAAPHSACHAAQEMDGSDSQQKVAISHTQAAGTRGHRPFEKYPAWLKHWQDDRTFWQASQK